MTRAELDRDNLCLRVEGHAGAGQRGSDIVCAAESILLFTLADLLLERSEFMHPELQLGRGRAVLRCRPEPGQRRRCLELFENFYRGYRLLAQHYPDFVSAAYAGAQSNLYGQNK